MADTARMLELMHPMREPPPPAAVAPYVAAAAIGLVVALCVYLALRQARRSDLRRSALAALAQSRALVPDERLAAQAALLRRLARRIGGERAARLHGSAWLESLDKQFGTRFFTSGEGRTFGAALYARGPAADVAGLDRSLAELIAKLPKRPADAA